MTRALPILAKVLFLGTGLLISRSKVAKQEEARWTQLALLNRAADYFAQTRKPREAWKTLADLEPQLNEFDLRCTAEDFDTAASVLLEIDSQYLWLWGHYRLMIESHERLQSRINDPMLKQFDVDRLGDGYYGIGQIQKAKICYEQALTIASAFKMRQNESISLQGLSNCYSVLGKTAEAIALIEKALNIDRELGMEHLEGIDLSNLGQLYGALGRTANAIESYRRALEIAHQVGDQFGEMNRLSKLSRVLIDEERYAEAAQSATESIKVGNDIRTLNSYNNLNLALAHLYAGNLPAARAAAEAARKYDVPQNNHNVLALLGIIALRQDDHTAAQEAFTAAIAHADKLLAQTPEYFDALDAKGVALCGLGLGLDNGQERINRTNQAVEVFHAARNINKDAGIVARVVRLLDALALADPQGAEKLAEARKAAGGEG